MTRRRFVYACLLASTASLPILTVWSGTSFSQTTTQSFQPPTSVSDPGVRGGAPGAGGPLPGLTAGEAAFFALGKEDFEEAEGVGDGLGPRFNLDGCGGCHTQPAIGGTSPAVNPQVAVATAFGARNVVPSFVRPNGPIRAVPAISRRSARRCARGTSAWAAQPPWPMPSAH